MAAATVKFVPSPKITPPFGTNNQGAVIIIGTIVFSAVSTDTYTTGGMSPLTGFAFANLAPYANRAPLMVFVQSSTGTGWNYQWNISTGKLQVFASAAGSNTSADGELASNTQLGAASPSIFTDVPIFYAIFPRSIS